MALEAVSALLAAAGSDPQVHGPGRNVEPDVAEHVELFSQEFPLVLAGPRMVLRRLVGWLDLEGAEDTVYAACGFSVRVECTDDRDPLLSMLYSDDEISVRIEGRGNSVQVAPAGLSEAEGEVYRMLRDEYPEISIEAASQTARAVIWQGR
jgi:hypothetical protein